MFFTIIQKYGCSQNNENILILVLEIGSIGNTDFKRNQIQQFYNNHNATQN